MVVEWWFKSACGHNSSKKGSRRFFPNVLGDTKKIRQCSHNGIGAGCYPVGRLFALQVRVLRTALTYDKVRTLAVSGRKSA